MEGTKSLSESNLILALFEEDLYFFHTLATFRLRRLEFYECLTHLSTVRPLSGFDVSWGKPFDSGHLFLVPSMVTNISSEKFTEIQDQMSEVPPSLPLFWKMALCKSVSYSFLKVIPEFSINWHSGKVFLKKKKALFLLTCSIPVWLREKSKAFRIFVS